MVGNLPTAGCKRAYGKIVRLEERIKRSESRGGLELIRGTQTGFAISAYNWCRGDPLEDVIDEESSPGDFIRSCKQTIDLLRQLSERPTTPSWPGAGRCDGRAQPGRRRLQRRLLDGVRPLRQGDGSRRPQPRWKAGNDRRRARRGADNSGIEYEIWAPGGRATRPSWPGRRWRRVAAT